MIRQITLFLRLLAGLATLTAVFIIGLRWLVLSPPHSDIGYVVRGVVVLLALYVVARIFGHSDPLDARNW